MRTRAQTVRLTPAQHTTLMSFAKSFGLSEYGMLARVVDAGLSALAQGTESRLETRELIAELTSLSTRILDAERMLDRVLFTTCAAYCYARMAGNGTPKSDEIVTQEITAAYNRQRRIAGEPTK